MEQKLADVGENGSVAGGDTVLGRSGKEFAQDEVDVGGGHELAGEGGGEFSADTVGFQELHLVARVEEAERRVVATEHAAAAAVGSLELTAIGIGRRLRRGCLIVVLFVVEAFFGIFMGDPQFEVTKWRSTDVTKDGRDSAARVAAGQRIGVGDGCEVSKDRVAQTVLEVKNNYVVIRMGVAN